MGIEKNGVPDMVALHAWRRRLKVSRQTVADRLGVSGVTVWRWETGGTEPGELWRRHMANLYADMEARPEEYVA